MAVEVVAGTPPIEAVIGAGTEEGARPTEVLPLRQLLQLSVYWFGINSIMGGLGVVVQKQIPALVAAPWDGPAIAFQSVVTMLMAAAIQPTIGMLSDHTISRWGRRKPYIAIGATLDVLFIIGLATSNTFLVMTAFLVLLQFSSNFAQGPFQGYVPDLVPDGQVGLASAMVGAMQTVGYIVGGIVVSLAYVLAKPGEPVDYTLPTIALGVVEFLTAMGTVFFVREGARARERRGRSWLEIARSAWGTDILRERSFVFLVLSRLTFFAGVNALLGWVIVYFNQTLRLTTEDKALLVPLTNVVVAIVTVIATFPSARVSDRIGRKPVIYVACAVGGLGLLVVALAPSYPIFLAGAVLLGAAAGTFLAVDWALMTDIIPKAASGRYMGISNIAVAASGALAGWVVGPLIDIVGRHEQQLPEGPRLAMSVAVSFFVLAAVFLRRVDPRPREARLAEAAAAPG